MCDTMCVCACMCVQETLVRFFLAVEDAYEPQERVPYHNSMHAADVVHSVHCLLNDPELTDAFSDVEVRRTRGACVVSCVTRSAGRRVIRSRGSC